MIYPIGPYAAAYLVAMAVAAWAVRNRPALLSAMLVIACEWYGLRLWHDLMRDRGTAAAHCVADFLAVYALLRWVPYSKEAERAADCFRAMLALHFIWAACSSFSSRCFCSR